MIITVYQQVTAKFKAFHLTDALCKMTKPCISILLMAAHTCFALPTNGMSHCHFMMGVPPDHAVYFRRADLHL